MPPDESGANEYACDGADSDPAAASECEPCRSDDAATGTWLSTDPIGHCPGDANYYRYVANDLTDGPEPLGL